VNRRHVIVSFLSAVALAIAAAPVSAQEVLGKGALFGLSGHKSAGSVSIVKTTEGIEVRLGEDFKFDGAPGPWLAFGKGGKFDRATQFSKLNANSGAQTYKVPAQIDASKYDEFYLWCRPFNVPLGVAKLK